MGFRFDGVPRPEPMPPPDVISAQTLVSQLADGLGLDELWEEFETILNFWNHERVSITDLLTLRPRWRAKP